MSAETIIQHLLEADDDDLKDIMLPDWQDDLKYLRQKLADGHVVDYIVVYPDGGIVIIFTDGHDWESKLAHTEINYMLQTWPSLQGKEIIRPPQEDPDATAGWQQEASEEGDEDLVKDVVHHNIPEPEKVKYGGREIRYGPYKLHWFDYPDGSRIVSSSYMTNFRMHWRKNPRTGEKHLVSVNKPSWHHGDIKKLEPGWQDIWEKWVRRCFEIFDRYSKGAWAHRYIPPLPNQKGEAVLQFGVAPPFDEEHLQMPPVQESEEDDWKELVHPGEMAGVDSWLARYMPPLGFKYQDMGCRGWEKTVGNTQVSVGLSTKPNMALMVRYRRYADTRWQNEEMESVPVGEPLFQKLREWGMTK